MTNASCVFLVTDSLGGGYDFENEVQMGKNGIDAAKEVRLTLAPPSLTGTGTWPVCLKARIRT